MAISNARTIVKQAKKIYSDKFISETSERRRGLQFDPRLPCDVVKKYRGTLLHDLVNLSNEQITNEQLPVRRPLSAQEKIAKSLGKLDESKIPFVKMKTEKPTNHIKKLWE